MTTPDYSKRVALLREELKKKHLDAIMVTAETNVSYLSGFLGHDSVLLVTAAKKHFITDSRYLEEARETIKGFDLQLVRESTYSTLAGLVKSDRLKAVGFESMNLPYEVATRLRGLVGESKLVPLKGAVEGLRAVKEDVEIEAIRRAARLTREVFDRVAGMIKPGMAESALAKAAEMLFIERGASAGFDPIVAAGRNSAKPHARPTDSKISDNSFVMIDLGCNLGGYNADLTRMVILGHVPEKFKKIYAIARAAQDAAIDKIRPGARIGDVDLAARKHIESNGFGAYFGHSTGHGIGMDVHEEPTVSSRNTDYLKPGMVFTVEPAIYIPKFGGARIEDMVLVTKTGCQVLTR